MASIFQKCKSAQPPCETKGCRHNWTTRYREPGGRGARQREKSFKRKKEAQAFADEVESKKNQGLYFDPNRGSITIQAWAEQWLSRKMLKASTRNAYRRFFENYLFPQMGRKTLAGTTAGDIEALLAVMHRKGLKPSTIKTRMIPLSGLFTDAVKDKRIPENPCQYVKAPRVAARAVDRDQIPNLETVRAIAEALPERYRLAVWLMAGAGLRISEALAVSTDCDRGSVLRVWQQASQDGEKQLEPLKHRQEGEYREIPLPDFVREQLQAHAQSVERITVEGRAGLLFPYDTERIMQSGHFTYQWGKALRSLELVKADGSPAYKPHDLRHYFASTALAGGVSLLEVSRWLGHNSIKTTADVYGHLTEDAPARMRRVMQDALQPPATPLRSVA